MRISNQAEAFLRERLRILNDSLLIFLPSKMDRPPNDHTLAMYRQGQVRLGPNQTVV